MAIQRRRAAARFGFGLGFSFSHGDIGRMRNCSHTRRHFHRQTPPPSCCNSSTATSDGIAASSPNMVARSRPARCLGTRHWCCRSCPLYAHAAEQFKINAKIVPDQPQQAAPRRQRSPGSPGAAPFSATSCRAVVSKRARCSRSFGQLRRLPGQQQQPAQRRRILFDTPSATSASPTLPRQAFTAIASTAGGMMRALAQGQAPFDNDGQSDN
jgi:hypothetical protein